MKFLLLIASLLAVCFGAKQQYTFYKGVNFTGDSVTIRSKTGDLQSVAPAIIGQYQSSCIVGKWGRYSGKDFNGYTSNTREFPEEFCTNYPSNSGFAFWSIRYLGPEDTATPAIAFYPSSEYSGTELVITTPAYAGIPFSPSSLVTTGYSNWTFFSGTNFDGTALCYQSTAEIHAIESLNATFAASIHSVLRGCDRHIDTYLFADSL